jgi:serine/threonine-protein kinase
VRIKLTDFGIAKVLDAQGVTSTGQILGSPAHMAPEQIEGGTIGSFTDVFALGVLMYECMVGHLPFQGSNPWQVLRRVLEGHYEPADSERPEVGGRWSSILLRALHVDAEQRLQSASELRALIDAELAALGIDDPRRCLDDFFADPAGFQQRLTVELVPRLIERGERERKKGDVQGAAADFNRALAFRPDDLVILRRVGSLTAQRIWKQRMTRAGAIAVTAFLLGGGSYALTRVLRPAHAVATAGPTAAPTLATNAPSAATVLVPSAHASSSRSADDPRVTPSASAAPPPVGSVPIAVDPPKKAVRKVKLTAAPSGAKLRLDGGEVEWFGATFELTPGSHQVQAYMPNDNVCCEPVTQSITVVAAKDDAEGPQTFTIGLKIKDAKAVLSGAPPDGKVSCDNGLVFAAGKSGVKTMTDLVAKTSCKFMPGGKRVDVTLSAGKTTPIAWLR